MKLGKPYPSYFDTSSEIRVWDFDFYPSFIPFSTDVFFSFLAAAGAESWWNFDAIEILSN